LPASLPLNELERLKALRRYKILDTKPEPEFDDITLLASHICGTPIALVTLVDENRQWFKSNIGMPGSETPRDIAFCAHTILQTEMLVVEDAQADERFAANPLVTDGAKIRFYAGSPLMTSEGQALGALCVIDQVPRELNLQQKNLLQALSRQVVALLELRRSLIALRQNEETLRVLFDLMPAMIWLKDTENVILRINSRVAESLGKPIEEIEGKSSLEVYPQDSVRLYSEDLEIIQSGMPKLGIVEMVKDQAGQALWLQKDRVPYCDKDGKVIGVIIMAQDITERKQAEAARDRLAAILECTTDLVSIADPNGNLLYLNGAARTLLGVGVDEDIRTALIADFVPDPATDPILIEGIPTAIRQGIWSGETVLLSRGGQEIPVSQVIIAHRTSEGKLEFVSTTMRDVTERRRLEARLMQSQKMETVGKLAGGIAHEFNSILTAIIGQSILLVDDLPAESPLLRNATEINKAAVRAAALTRQLLAYGRQQILRPETLNLNSVLASMENTLRHLVGKDVNARIAPASGLKTVKADAGQIEQVIVNMVINARNAMPNGGNLTLETANISFDQESSSRYPELKPGNYVMLAIADTGLGMSAEFQAHLFEPFFGKSVGKGIGLGLSTSYGIIKQSGGHISVYSEPARGAVFKIYLPESEEEAKLPVPRVVPSELPRGTETILLAEDDPSLLEMSATLFRRLGYTVLTAANGVEALNLKHQRDVGHIDLLFTDVVMPHMSGKELSERIRAIYPLTKILFTSAYTANAAVHQGVLNAGVTLLQKPFTPTALANKVRELLDSNPL
jgi:two-component system, cell cycle sensor histidine kinase and response regulator CckA